MSHPRSALMTHTKLVAEVKLSYETVKLSFKLGGHQTTIMAVKTKAATRL